MMLRAGAGHPDADGGASTSRGERGDTLEDGGMDSRRLHSTLSEYLQLEPKFQPRLCLPAESDVRMFADARVDCFYTSMRKRCASLVRRVRASRNSILSMIAYRLDCPHLNMLRHIQWNGEQLIQSGEVSTGARDGAAHVLRCLKVWYDLPADVLISAISLFDRFLTKMKVRPCHVPCITVSCMNIALQEYAELTDQPTKVSVEELVSISQSACTAGDVSRMSRVIMDKLSVAQRGAITPLHWLRLFRDIVLALADELAMRPPVALLPEKELVKLLEIAVCDASCVNARTSELALVLVYHQLEQQLVEWSRLAAAGEAQAVPADAYCLYDYALQLQAYCHMSDASLAGAGERVRAVLARYEARQAAPQRQRLVWRLSERTLKVLRPTDRLTSLLPTIEEQHFAVDSSPARKRSGSESSESEDTSDWPRSPVLPVYCHN